MNEEGGTIIHSDSVAFDSNLKLEKLPERFYGSEEEKLADKLWELEMANNSKL